MTINEVITILSSKSCNIDDQIKYLLIKNLAMNENSKNIDIKNINGEKLNFILTDSKDKQSIIDYFLDNDIPLTYSNIYYLMKHSSDLEKTIDTLLNKGLTIDKILEDELVDTLLYYSKDNDKQKTIDILLKKNIPLTDKNLDNLIGFSSDTQKTIDILLNKNIPASGKNVEYFIGIERLIESSSDKIKTIDTLLNQGVSIEKICTEDILWNLLYNPSNYQKIIDYLLSKGASVDRLFTNLNIDHILLNSSNKQQMIDYLLSKNVPLTDENISNLLKYSSNKTETQAKIDALRAKQQGLTERHLNYKSFFRYL